jgi:hypothetical protein
MVFVVKRVAYAVAATITVLAVLCGTTVPSQAAPDVGPNGTSTMHGDAGASDTTPYAGPGAHPRPAQTVPLGAVCPTILAGSDGLVQALCTGYLDRAPALHLLDPDTFLPTATLHLEKGSLLGGVYAYVDGEDRLVTADGSGAILLIAHDRNGPLGSWRLFVERRIPVRDSITTLNPGYDGRIWFGTADGKVGYADPRTGAVRSTRLPGRTQIVANSIASSPEGTSVVTDRATYLVTADRRGRIDVAWRRTYDRGPARKPGQLSRGSGATPTFFGPRTGHEYVAITDNARPRAHLLVYRARTGERVCQVPLFNRTSSGTENSPIGWRDQIYVASTYGYPYPATPDGAGEADPATADFVGGMQRFRVRRNGCELVWSEPIRSAAVPKLSIAEGVIYTVTRSDAQLYQLARIAPEDGAVLSETPLGLGPLADTLQMVGTVLPDGTLLQGSTSGLSVVRPGDS